MNKPRLEAFTDAIIAIAATIMVLELRPPEENTLSALFKLTPTFVAYLISFMLIYIVWYGHHNLFYKAKKVTPAIFVWNGIWLFFLTLTPFTTAWVGRDPNAALPEFMYALNLLLWSLVFQFLDRAILNENPEAKKDPSDSLGSRLVLYIGFGGGMILAFIFPPAFLALALCITLWDLFQIVLHRE